MQREVTRGAHSSGPRARLIALAMAAATAFGLLSVWFIGRHDRVESAASFPLVSRAVADVSAPAVGPVPGGDARIGLIEIRGSTLAPIVGDGQYVWVAVMENVGEDGASEGALLRFEPASGSLSRVATFEGSPTALSVAGGRVFIGAGHQVVVVDVRADGSAAAVARLERPVDAGGSIVAITVMDQRLLVASSDSTAIVVLDAMTGDHLATYDVGRFMPPPARLVALDGSTLLATTPFGQVGGHAPGSVLLDLTTGELRSVDVGRPFDWSAAGDGAFVTTQSIPGGGLRGVSRGDGFSVVVSPFTTGRSIPWDGRWDLVAAGPDGAIWGASMSSSAIHRESAAGRLDSFALPVVATVPSIPPGTDISNEDYASLATTVRRPVSLAVLDDGSLVFLVAHGGTAIGYIPGPE